MSIELIRVAIEVVGENIRDHSGKVVAAQSKYREGRERLEAAKHELELALGQLAQARTCFNDGGDTVAASKYLTAAQNTSNAAGLEQSNNQDIAAIVSLLGLITTNNTGVIKKFRHQAEVLGPPGTMDYDSPVDFVDFTVHYIDRQLSIGDPGENLGNFMDGVSELSAAIAEVDI